MDVEIYFLIVFVVVILFSAFAKQKKIQQQQQAPPLPPEPPVVPEPWIATSRPSVPRVPKKQNAPIQSPEKEGAHAVKVPPAVTEDAYAEPHSDVPRNDDWRRAVIAHEILKTKF